MNTKTKRGIAAGSSIAAVGAIVLGAWGVGSAIAGQPSPEPEPTVSTVSFERPASDFEDKRPDVTPTPTPEPTEEPVVEEAPAEPAPAPAPAQPVAPAPAPAEPAPAPAPAPPAPAPAPPAPEPAPEPVKCPAGTVPGAVDGAGNESMCQTPCEEWIDTDGDGNAETCARP